MTQQSLARAQDLLDKTRAETSAADNKASILLAGVLAAAGGVSAAIGSADWAPSAAPLVVRALLWLTVATTLSAVGSLGLVVYPRGRSSPTDGALVGYYGDVVGLDGVTALRQALEDQSGDPMGVLVDQTWQLSHIVLRKYRYLRIGMCLLCTSAGLGLLTLVLSLVS